MDYLCSDCPRRCGAERSDTKSGGVCASPALPRVARAAPHFGEEPCISGSRGAGTIFFTGCNLRCVFCQNRAISRGGEGRAVSVEALRSMMLRLRDEGVHCIDLVTPTHYLRAVREALKGLELGIPVVWNSSGYESVDALRTLEGLVQVYLPDYKYSDAALQRGVLLQTLDRRVLAHQRKQNAAGRKALRNKVDRAHRVLDLAGQDQMPDQHARDEQAVLIHAIRPRLAEHLPDRG